MSPKMYFHIMKTFRKNGTYPWTRRILIFYEMLRSYDYALVSHENLSCSAQTRIFRAGHLEQLETQLGLFSQSLFSRHLFFHWESPSNSSGELTFCPCSLVMPGRFFTPVVVKDRSSWYPHQIFTCDIIEV